MKPVERKRRVSIHEAGHATAVRGMGHTVDSVEVADGIAFNGKTDWTAVVVGDETLNPPGRAAIVSMAGYVAEILVMGDHDELFCVSDKAQAWLNVAASLVWGNDAELAKLKAIHDSGVPVEHSQWSKLPETKEAVARLEIECRKILDSNKDDLIALADHLERHGSCLGMDIDAICAKKWQGAGSPAAGTTPAPATPP